VSDRHLVKSKNVLVMEIVGTAFIIFLGSALHFTYALSGNQPLVAFFSAINEAVWEHLKLAFWPSLLWILIEFNPLRKMTDNFLPAKAIGTYVMVVFIPIVFYSYTSFTGRSILQIDITTFVVAVVIGQVISYKLMQKKKLPKFANIISIIALILLTVLFVVFTFFPPHLPPFQDPNTGQYGI
jgi:Family of unknown function (DUF6512)